MKVESLRFDDRDAWLEARREDFTASEVGALYGEHKYTTLRQIAVEKTSGRRSNNLSPVLRRGIIMEPAIAAAMMHDHGLRCQPVHNYLRGRSPADPFLRVGATKDYQLHENAERLLDVLGDRFPDEWRRHLGDLPMSLACEMKSVDWNVYEKEYLDGCILQHQAQAATQAWLGGDDGALVIVLVQGFSLPLHIYPVVRNRRWEEETARRISDFWRRLEAGEEQPLCAGDPASAHHPVGDPQQTAQLGGLIDTSDAMRERLASVSSMGDAMMALADTSKHDTWNRRLELREVLGRAADVAKGTIETMEDELRHAIGGAAQASIPGWKASWKNDRNGIRRLLVRREKAK